MSVVLGNKGLMAKVFNIKFRVSSALSVVQCTRKHGRRCCEKIQQHRKGLRYVKVEETGMIRSS